MKILVFDTCFNKTYIVLRQDDKILASKVISSTDSNYHSAYLIPEIRNILKENNILIKDLDAIGVNIGPGSFTGIRAGITIARVLAQQTNIKLVGVESLKILSRINKTKNPTLVVTDARKNKVYLSKNNMPPILVERDNIKDYINPDDVIISDNSIGDLLQNTIRFEENDSELGLYLAQEVYERLKSGNDFHWAKVKPLYIQQPSITKKKTT